VLAAALVASGVAITLTDIHGRDQVTENVHALGVDRHRLVVAQQGLVTKESETQAAYNEVQSVESSTATNQAGVTSANASTAAADVGIFVDGTSLPTLNTCLTGVFQVLDQIDVGQAGSAVSELVNLSPVCSLVSP